MPCDSSYMNPTKQEAYSRHVASMAQKLFRSIGEKPPELVINAAGSMYGCVEHDDILTDILCSLIRSFDKDQMDVHVWNGRDKDARDLADWWEKHEEADFKREAIERRAAIMKAEPEVAKQKLTPQQLVALTEEILDSRPART